MKTKYLLGACALSALFVGCSNEEFLQEANVPQTPTDMEEVVGADLASAGMKIVVNKGAQTRVNEGGWEATDVIGMGWYNIAKNIFEVQDVNNWTASKLANLRDYKIYANDKFFVCDGDFTTNANIYQGAHFVYFPYELQGQIGTRSFEVNPTQVADAQTELYNKALHISAQDFISADEVKDANGVLTKQFVLAPMVNAIKVIATPDKDVMNEVMSKYTINGTNIYAGTGVNAFRTNTGNIKPNLIPMVIRDNAGDIKVEETAKEMAKGANLNKVFSNTTYTNHVTTYVKSKDITLAGEATVRTFILPTSTSVTAPNSSLAVYVGRYNSYHLGYFDIKNDAEETNETLNKLNDALTKNGYNGYTLQNIILDKDNVWQPLNLPVDLTLDNFVPMTDAIYTVEQWNDLVELYDALIAIDAKKWGKTAPVFKLAADLEFKEGIKTLKDAKNKIELNTNGKKLIVAGDAEWPANLKTDKTDKVEVAADAVLTVGDEIVLDADITNKGRIEAGYKASISTKASKKLTNDGRVIVTYGAYVYPATGEDGVIAFKVEDNSAATMGKINDLIETSASVNDEFAYVNMLMVYTTFDLDAKATSSDDNPYNPSDATNLNDLAGVDIELYANGGITNKAATGNESVKSITAVEGASSISDVEIVNGALTIEKKAILDVKSARKPNLKDLNLTGDIINVGKLYVNTDIYCVNVFNAETGLIDVNKARKVTYTNKNDNKGKEEANGGLGVVKDDTPVIDADAAALKAARAINALIGQDASLKDKNTFVANVNTHSTDAGQKAVLEAINLWLKATGKSEITTLTVDIINDLANVNGIKLDFN